MSNTGHGHVRPRPDGVKARCGGPGLCSVCLYEQQRVDHDATKVTSPPLAPEAPGIWIQTLPRLGERHGRAFDLVNPTPEMVDFSTIATVLARVPRFGGHTGGGVLSVAQHCTEGANAILREGGGRLAAAAFLLHDAHEAYIGDIATPVALALECVANQNALTIAESGQGGAVRDAIASLKARIDSAIYQAAGLPWPLDPQSAALVKLYDRRMLETERRARLAIPPHAWREQYTEVEGADMFAVSEGSARAFYWRLACELLPALGGSVAPDLCGNG